LEKEGKIRELIERNDSIYNQGERSGRSGSSTARWKIGTEVFTKQNRKSLSYRRKKEDR